MSSRRLFLLVFCFSCVSDDECLPGGGEDRLFSGVACERNGCGVRIFFSSSRVCREGAK